MKKKKMVSLPFRFVVPAGEFLDVAKRMAQSENQDERDVGKAVVDTTEIMRKTEAAVKDVKNKGTYDLGPFFDCWHGDSLDAAKRLKNSADAKVRNVADILMDQADAIINCKDAFLKMVKMETKEK